MRYALIVDLGATNLRVAIVNDKQEILEKIKVSTDRNVDIAFKIYGEYKNLNKDYKLEGIVVAVPGSINFKENIIRDLPNLNIKNYNLKDALYKLFDVPVTIINDASLAALGEYSLHREEDVFQYITISSGIGGGLIYKGKLFEGNNGFEQEIGRMDINGFKFEDLCSGTALKNRLLKVGIDEEYPSSAFISSNPLYKKIVDEWLDDLSIGICNVVKIINPSLIVLGGGVGVYLDYFKKKLFDRLNLKLPFDIVKDLKIEKAIYQDDSALIGGSCLIFQDN